MTRTQAEAWFVLQGVAGLIWWVLMFRSDRVQDWFVGEAWLTARTVALADLVLFVGGSLIVAALVRRGSVWQHPALWLLVGAVGYATLVALSWGFEPVERWLGLLFMAPAAAVTAWAAFSASDW